MRNVCSFCGEPAAATTGEKWLCPSCEEIYKLGYRDGGVYGRCHGYADGKFDERILWESRK
jgi:hypothetical protein